MHLGGHVGRRVRHSHISSVRIELVLRSCPDRGLLVGVCVQPDEVHLELNHLLDVQFIIVQIPLVRALAEVVKGLHASDVDAAGGHVLVLQRRPRLEHGLDTDARYSILAVQPEADTSRLKQGEDTVPARPPNQDLLIMPCYFGWILVGGALGGEDTGTVADRQVRAVGVQHVVVGASARAQVDPRACWQRRLEQGVGSGVRRPRARQHDIAAAVKPQRCSRLQRGEQRQVGVKVVQQVEVAPQLPRGRLVLRGVGDGEGDRRGLRARPGAPHQLQHSKGAREHQSSQAQLRLQAQLSHARTRARTRNKLIRFEIALWPLLCWPIC